MANEHLTPRDTPIKVGDQAPDFELPDQDQKPVRLSTLVAEGKGDVVLSFYPMDFSPVCSTELGCFTRDIAKFENKGATVVGVSCDSFFTHKAWSETLGLKIPLLADMHRAVCKAYGLYFAPLNVAARGTVIVDRDMKIKWVEARELGKAVDNERLLAAIS